MTRGPLHLKLASAVRAVLLGILPSLVGQFALKPEGSRLTPGGWLQNYKRTQFQSLVRGCICWARLLGRAVFPPWNKGPNSGSYTTDLGSSPFSVLSFCLFVLFTAFSRQEYWSDLPFPSPVDHILSDLSTMTLPFWVAPYSMA